VSKTEKSSPRDAAYLLKDEVEAFPAEKADEALTHLARGMAKLLDADNVKWLAAVRVYRGVDVKKDPLLGWRLRASYDLVPESEEYRKSIAWWFQRSNEIEPNFLIGLATHAMVAGAGKFRVHRMRDGWIPYAAFRKTEHYRLHYTELGITDRMWVSLPLNVDTESIFLVDRQGAKPNFSKRDAALAGDIVRGLRSFQRLLFVTRGLQIGEMPLSPTFRRVLKNLLTGMTEKQIAAELKQPPATTHKYVRSIYKRFGVNGRAGLMALCLGA
jgi:DNA-binding CsgD family transcriptional regulator